VSKETENPRRETWGPSFIIIIIIIIIIVIIIIVATFGIKGTEKACGNFSEENFF